MEKTACCETRALGGAVQGLGGERQGEGWGQIARWSITVPVPPSSVPPVTPPVAGERRSGSEWGSDCYDIVLENPLLQAEPHQMP